MNWEKILYVQYLIQLMALVTINNYLLFSVSYFVMVILHVLIPAGHLQGGYLQKNTFIMNAAQDLHI